MNMLPTISLAQLPRAYEMAVASRAAAVFKERAEKFYRLICGVRA